MPTGNKSCRHCQWHAATFSESQLVDSFSTDRAVVSFAPCIVAPVNVVFAGCAFLSSAVLIRAVLLFADWSFFSLCSGIDQSYVLSSVITATETTRAYEQDVGAVERTELDL